MDDIRLNGNILKASLQHIIPEVEIYKIIIYIFGVSEVSLWQVTNWDKKFNDVDDYKQNKILKHKHISAEQLKKLKIENGNIKLLSTGKFDGYSKESLCKEYINEDEVITIPSG